MLLLRRQSKVLSSLQYFAANLVSRAFLQERDGRPSPAKKSFKVLFLGLGEPWISILLTKDYWLIDCFNDLLIYLFNHSFKGSRFQNIPWGIWRGSSEFGILRGMNSWLIDWSIDWIDSLIDSLIDWWIDSLIDWLIHSFSHCVISRFGPNWWARNR